ncbi:hypothetical protein ElyMa_003182800 [Elysia marginata]|uniref:Uncharacterized protein n=1 Tax=Elysia marginata TaxID=1093978 RepID=A0AAV4J002_9GAST|nr:hypothetical protein ElyMa_003182800 [Elysia marginata]
MGIAVVVAAVVVVGVVTVVAVVVVVVVVVTIAAAAVVVVVVYEKSSQHAVKATETEMVWAQHLLIWPCQDHHAGYLKKELEAEGEGGRRNAERTTSEDGQDLS